MPHVTYVKYCGVDDTELPPHMIVKQTCKCHNKSMFYYCMDCSQYIAFYAWSGHVKLNDGHKRRTFNDLETVEIIDLNADPDDEVPVVQKKRRPESAYSYFIKSRQGASVEDLTVEWNGLSQEQKDEYSTASYYTLESDDDKPKKKRKRQGTRITGYSEYLKSTHGQNQTQGERTSAWNALPEEEKQKFNEQAIKMREKSAEEAQNNRPNKRRNYRSGFHEYRAGEGRGLTRKEQTLGWRALSHERRKEYTKRAHETSTSQKQEHTSVSVEEKSPQVKRSLFKDQNGNESDSSYVEEEDETEEPPKKKRKVNGYVEYIKENRKRGKTLKELGTAWRSLTDEERNKYSGSNTTVSDAIHSSDPIESVSMTVREMEEYTFVLCSLVQAEKEHYISKEQFRALETIIITNHYLKGTVKYVASLLKEYMQQGSGTHRWNQIGAPILDSLLRTEE